MSHDENTLSILVSMAVDLNGVRMLSSQKFDKKGKRKGGIVTHALPKTLGNEPEKASEIVRSIMKEIGKRKIYHHAQPEIIQILNELLTHSSMIELNNSTVCTQTMLEELETCGYDASLIALARRQGTPESQVLFLDVSSEKRCETYTEVFCAYIRHVRGDIFGPPTPAPTYWGASLNITEQAIIADTPESHTLPDGWTQEEAQAIWLSHSAGSPIEVIAELTGASKSVISEICGLFQRTPCRI